MTRISWVDNGSVETHVTPWIRVLITSASKCSRTFVTS